MGRIFLYPIVKIIHSQLFNRTSKSLEALPILMIERKHRYLNLQEVLKKI